MNLNLDQCVTDFLFENKFAICESYVLLLAAWNGCQTPENLDFVKVPAIGWEFVSITNIFSSLHN